MNEDKILLAHGSFTCHSRVDRIDISGNLLYAFLVDGKNTL